DCIARASGGSCLECTGCAAGGRGLDPRDNTDNPGSSSSGLTGPPGLSIAPPPGSRSSDLGSLQQQLSRIEKCTCGTRQRVSGVPRAAVPFRQWATIPVGPPRIEYQY